MRSLLLMFLICLYLLPTQARDQREYLEAKKELLEQDRAYLEHVKNKERVQKQQREGLEEFKRQKAWREWRSEKARRQYIQKRDAQERLPASVQEAQEQKHNRALASELQAREKARQEFLRKRDIRQSVREELEVSPLSESIRQRNERPWEL